MLIFFELLKNQKLDDQLIQLTYTINLYNQIIQYSKLKWINE